MVVKRKTWFTVSSRQHSYFTNEQGHGIIDLSGIFGGDFVMEYVSQFLQLWWFKTYAKIKAIKI